MAGTYRDDRRRAGGRIASSLRGAGKKAARAFFGASPTQKKKLRKTVDKRGVKLNQLDLDGLDRSKFNAPEKVGESVKLIDIAMGIAPAGPAPGLAPPPPPPIPERAPRRPRPTASRPQRTASGRLPPPGAEVDEDEEEQEDEEDERSGAGIVTGLSSLLALACLVFVLAGGPLLRIVKPALVPLADSYRESALVLGLFFTWVAMSLGRLRAPRGGFVTELVRALLFASAPALGGAGWMLWSVGALPSLPVAPPAAFAFHASKLLEHVAPLAAATGLAVTYAACVAWGLVCFVVALIVRRVAARAEAVDE